jgi:ATPase subunit of ABC transporter with duplicated ATPase domains
LDRFPQFPENIMISVSNVSMRYGAKVLFDEVSTGFVPGKRYGLTGPNGAGKSTFMKLLTGELEPQKGTVVRPRKLGVLEPGSICLR